jgi:hypothetical protein
MSDGEKYKEHEKPGASGPFANVKEAEKYLEEYNKPGKPGHNVVFYEAALTMIEDYLKTYPPGPLEPNDVLHNKAYEQTVKYFITYTPYTPGMPGCNKKLYDEAYKLTEDYLEKYTLETPGCNDALYRAAKKKVSDVLEGNVLSASLGSEVGHLLKQKMPLAAGIVNEYGQFLIDKKHEPDILQMADIVDKSAEQQYKDDPILRMAAHFVAVDMRSTFYGSAPLMASFATKYSKEEDKLVGELGGLLDEKGTKAVHDGFTEVGSELDAMKAAVMEILDTKMLRVGKSNDAAEVDGVIKGFRVLNTLLVFTEVLPKVLNERHKEEAVAVASPIVGALTKVLNDATKKSEYGLNDLRTSLTEFADARKAIQESKGISEMDIAEMLLRLTVIDLGVETNAAEQKKEIMTPLVKKMDYGSIIGEITDVYVEASGAQILVAGPMSKMQPQVSDNARSACLAMVVGVIAETAHFSDVIGRVSKTNKSKDALISELAVLPAPRT